MVDMYGLRVAMVIQSYLPRLGGAEKQLAAICCKLRLKGIKPCVITRRYEGMASFELIDQTPVFRVPAPQPKILAALCYLFFGLLKINKVKPHLIHAHELLTPTDMAVLAKCIWHIPAAVKVLRGGKLGDIYKLNHRVLGRMRIGRMAAYIDRFITISSEIADELVGEGFDSGKCRFIPNGVDIDVYQPATKKERKVLRGKLELPQGFICVFSGRLAPEKGLKTLFSAWKEICSRHKDAYLLVLGSGPLESELRSAKVKNVIFRGYVPEPLKFYQASDAFILPSETEGLSNAMLEAMACGLAVLATRVGAAGEIITDGDNGMLLKAGSVDDIIQALEHLLSNPGKIARIGKAGRQKVVTAYSLDNTVDRLVDLYMEMMEAAQ